MSVRVEITVHWGDGQTFEMNESRGDGSAASDAASLLTDMSSVVTDGFLQLAREGGDDA
jgi:hypothetical protein